MKHHPSSSKLRREIAQRDKRARKARKKLKRRARIASVHMISESPFMTIADKMAIVKSEIAGLKKTNSRLSFVRGWNSLKIKRPELFRESADSSELATKAAFARMRAFARMHALGRSTVTVSCELPYILEGEAPAQILYLPRGRTTIHARVNGEPQTVTVEVDEATARALQADLEMRLARPVKPIGGFNHRQGAASFIPKGFMWDAKRGVVLNVDWTKSGREAIEGRDFMHFSPTFTMAGDRVKGLTERGEIGSLTNAPAFENLGSIA